ncbi:hypothetical protein F5050DRAFT_1827724 [Lentinula boryana]|uniref:Uncharacterized protein n=1 Tax=Lentinula boryana TaxID=40481 RepID=A0ABQ8QA72_9AGAR|nr:hypothetical protein F5050DRAFT_1827724 [Lentinula boryana]
MIGQIGGPPGGDSDPGSGDDEDDKDDKEEEPGSSNKTPLEKLKPASSVTNSDNDAVGPATTHRSDLTPNGQGSTGRIAEKNSGGIEFGAKLDGLERQLRALERFASQSTMAILVRREEREMGREENVDNVKIVQGTLRYLLDLLMNGIGLGEAISNTLAPFGPRSASEDNMRIGKTMRDVQRDSDD